MYQGRRLWRGYREACSSQYHCSITPALTEIPYVGWLVAGFFNMFGQKQGAEIGGQMARDFQDC